MATVNQQEMQNLLDKYTLLNESKSDLSLFEKHLPLYQSVIKNGAVKNYTSQTYNELIYLYMKYISVKHQFSHWCGDCRIQLVVHLFNWYYDYMANQVPNPLAEFPRNPETPNEPVTQPKKRGRKPKGGCSVC